MTLNEYKDNLPGVWRRAHLAQFIAEKDKLQPWEGYPKAEELMKTWRKEGLIKQTSRGITFWRFV